MTRIFVYDGRAFPDPDPALSVDQVRQHLSTFFPELANAETKEEKRGDDTVYTFSKRIGTKGQPPPPIIAILRRVPQQRLRVYALAAELLDEHGELKLAAAVLCQPEINLALAEATAYAKATRQAVQALRKALLP